MALVKETWFDVIKADWLRYQAKQPSGLSDEELEDVVGGGVCIISNNDRCHVFSSSILGLLHIIN